MGASVDEHGAQLVGGVAAQGRYQAVVRAQYGQQGDGPGEERPRSFVSTRVERVAQDGRDAVPRERREAELDAERKNLGVDDALKEVPGMTTAMLVALGKDGVKHAALLKGAAARRFEREAARLDGFRAGVGVTPQEIEFGPE